MSLLFGLVRVSPCEEAISKGTFVAVVQLSPTTYDMFVCTDDYSTVIQTPFHLVQLQT
jgi:hypothetical protein